MKDKLNTNKIITEWAYRLQNGTPNMKNRFDLHVLRQVLVEQGYPHNFIKEYMDTAVKNDEHLVKLAGVLQRIISKSQGDSDESMLLSDEEKEELMGTLQDTVEDLQNESDRLEGIKNKTIDLGN